MPVYKISGNLSQRPESRRGTDYPRLVPETTRKTDTEIESRKQRNGRGSRTVCPSSLWYSEGLSWVDRTVFVVGDGNSRVSLQYLWNDYGQGNNFVRGVGVSDLTVSKGFLRIPVPLRSHFPRLCIRCRKFSYVHPCRVIYVRPQ